MSEVSITVCPDVCMCWCMCVHMLMHEMCLEMPKVCTICARHGIWEQSELNTSKTYETSSIKENLSKRTHLKPTQPKDVTWTFCLACNNAQQWWKMHDHSENMPQYMLELPHGANTDAKTPNGTKPNQEIEKQFSQKLESQPNFWKSLIFKNLSTNSA